MMNRRDFLLQEMQIPQWVLRKPQVLKGDARIRLDETIQFVVICDEDHQQSQQFHDILHALALSTHQYQWLNGEQAMRLQFAHSPLFWQIGKPARDFAKKWENCTAWQTENWQDLAQSTHKRQLWQQIQHFLADRQASFFL